MVSAAGFEPTAPGFLPLRLSPPRCRVRGLDCLFTIGLIGQQVPPVQSLHLPARSWRRGRLGSGLAKMRNEMFCYLEAFPEFEWIHHEVSRRSAQFLP